MRYKDFRDVWSPWSEETSFTTAVLSVSFDYTPKVPLVGEEITFSATQAPCIFSYDWSFPTPPYTYDEATVTHSFPDPGEYVVSLTITNLNGEMVEMSRTVSVHTIHDLRYAIIVASDGISWMPFDKHGIDHGANFVYKVLRNLGFDDDHIFYLNSKNQDIDGDGDFENDYEATESSFMDAISQVKHKTGNRPTQFILYLIGHGVPLEFLINEVDGLHVMELQRILNGFSAETRMLIVIDACDSESFITGEYEQTISAQNRIIVTACAEKRPVAGVLLSTERFWGNLNEGLNVKEAFVKDAKWIGDRKLRLDDNGDRKGHPPDNLGDDGELAAVTWIGVPGTEDLKLSPWYYFGLGSPAELRIYDSQNRVTGLVNGEVKEEIPDSVYDQENAIVAIFSPNGYRCEIMGADTGTYRLDMAFVESGKATFFTAHDIPTTSGVVHQYIVDWDALTLGEEGVTVMVDSDGDGVFEHTFTSDSEFTQSEYVIATDNTPPQTWLNIGEPKFVVNEVTYLTSATPIGLIAEDNPGGSGVASTAYRIYNATFDSGWIIYSQPFYLIGLSDGTYCIAYNSTDFAGNIEPTKTLAIILDNTPPTTTLSIGEPKYVTEITYVTSATPILLEANDNTGSGVYSIAYRIYNGTFDSGWLPYTAPFYLTALTDGAYTIEFSSTDNLGNVETRKSIQVTLFSWDYIFTDTYGRGTVLKINTEHKFFQFMRPSKDYGIKKATYMISRGDAIVIQHYDRNLWLVATANTKLDFCIATAYDLQTRKTYTLIDKPGIEK